jgi:hypothetical protein
VLAVVKEQAIFHMRTRSHIETITMDIMPTGRHSLVLGLPWMEIHDPWVKMAERELIFTSQYCCTNCLNIDDHVEIQTPQDTNGEIYGVDGTTFANPRQYVPEELHSYLDVFNDRKAKRMPQSCGEWDFQINFVNGWETKLPRPAKQYWLSESEQQAKKETLDELLRAGMISPSRSPVAAPTFFVPKKDGSQQYVVDWRGINAITIKDAYPLPLLNNLLDMAQGAVVMSKFDLMASYNQILIRQQDRWKTAFITSCGLFEFNVMHFGFSNAPPHMQRYMEHVLQPVEHRNVWVYLDDIPAFSKTRGEHIQTLKMILQ